MLRFEQFEDRRMLAGFEVNVAYDTMSTDLDNTIITLREAVVRANLLSDADIITFASGLDGATITLGKDIDGDPLNFTGENGALFIDKSVTIDASALNRLTIDASGTEQEIVILQGLTIQGGDTSGNGGGVLFIGDTTSATAHVQLTISDSVITGNHAEGSGRQHDGGGGLFAEAYASDPASGTPAIGVVIERSLISHNSTSASHIDYDGGGGVSIITEGFSSLITESEITNNVSAGNGGGAFLRVRGLSATNAPEIRITDSLISGNKSQLRGGGLSVKAGRAIRTSSPFDASITIERSTISNNISYDEGGGGFSALLYGNNTSTDSAKFTIAESTVSGNQAFEVADSNANHLGGGGGGYMCAKFGGTFEATNSTFSGNQALDPSFGTGGGLLIARYHDPADLEVIANLNHLTITNNLATDGGGLHSRIDPEADLITTLSHSIVSGNEDGSGTANNVAGSINATSNYNFWGPSTATLPVANNIDDPGNDPKLTSLLNFGGPTKTHRPLGDSGVIDKGLANITTAPSFDQRGNPFTRILDGDNDSSVIIDIGAVEVEYDDIVLLTGLLQNDVSRSVVFSPQLATAR